MRRWLVLGFLTALFLGGVQGCSKNEDPVHVSHEFKNRMPRALPGGTSPALPAKKPPPNSP